ncbi:MAG: ABC transporter ATP-binding protein [Candidatus Rokubacteria bacterium]|nr:ABC transporter ATP-binding protein [Candidatus Rokubacteria bacterium]
MAVVLETEGLTKAFGGVLAVDGVSVAVAPGQIVGIVGSNGAGKTTFVNLVTGYLKPDRGRIAYLGRDITGEPPREVCRLGIARSFQIPQIYASLTVLENVLIALAARERATLRAWAPLRTPTRVEAARALLEPFGLTEHAGRPVSELPEGGLKLLDIALAGALEPRLLLLDEPTSGVSSKEKFAVMDTLVRILRARGVTVIFVEHDMDVVTGYAERVLAFSEGKILADGPPAAVLADPAVRKAVLGWA